MGQSSLFTHFLNDLRKKLTIEDWAEQHMSCSASFFQAEGRHLEHRATAQYELSDCQLPMWPFLLGVAPMKTEDH